MSRVWSRIGETGRWLLVSLALIAILAGCAPAQAPAAESGEAAEAGAGDAVTPEAGEEAAAPAEGDKIKVSWLNHWGSPEETEYWDKVAADFEAQNPNIDIEILNTGFNDLMTTFMTQYGAGNSPDVFHIKYDR